MPPQTDGSSKDSATKGLHGAHFKPHHSCLDSAASSSTVSEEISVPKSHTASDSDSDVNTESTALHIVYQRKTKISEWLEEIDCNTGQNTGVTDPGTLQSSLAPSSLPWHKEVCDNEVPEILPAEASHHPYSTTFNPSQTTNTTIYHPSTAHARQYSPGGDGDIDMESSHPSSIADIDDLYGDEYEKIMDYRDFMILKRKRNEEEEFENDDNSSGIGYAIGSFKRFKIA